MWYRGAIFDMGDVFFDATPWRRALAAQLADLGVDIDYPRLVPLWEEALVPVYVGVQPYWDAFREFLVLLGLNEAQVAGVEAAARARAQQSEERVLFDGVAKTLAELHTAGVRMAVLSDTESPAEIVRQRLAQMGLDCYFAGVVTSRDLGYVKPQPEAYQAALDELHLDKGDVVFVGHDIDELQGAQAFGIAAVAYNHERGAPADFYLEHFSELLPLVTSGSGPPG